MHKAMSCPWDSYYRNTEITTMFKFYEQTCTYKYIHVYVGIDLHGVLVKGKVYQSVNNQTCCLSVAIYVQK